MTIEEEIRQAELDAQIAEAEEEARQMELRDPPQIENSDFNLAKNLNRLGGTARAIIVNKPELAVLRTLLGTKPRDMVKDIKSGVEGTFPGSSQLLAEEGVPSGPEIAYGITPRDAVGFGLDTIIDPTGPLFKFLSRGSSRLVSKGAAKAAAKLEPSLDEIKSIQSALAPKTFKQRLQNALTDTANATAKDAIFETASGTPLASFLRGAGRKISDSAYAPLDAAVTSGPKPSAVMWEKTLGTTKKGMAKKVEKVINKLAQQNSEIAHTASPVAPKISQTEAVKLLEAEMGRLSDNAMNIPLIRRWENLVKMYKISPDITVDKAVEFARQSRAAAKAAYGQGGSTAPATAQLHRELTRGFMDEARKSISKIPGTGEKAAKTFRKNNLQMGSLIEAEPVAASVSYTPPLSVGDVVAGTFGSLRGGLSGAAKWLLLKKTLNSMVGPGARTYGGRALHTAGQIPLLDQAALQGYVHSDPPWKLMNTVLGEQEDESKK
jgi:hypothetical protein